MSTVESTYLPVVHAIVLRLAIAQDAIGRVEADPNAPLAQGVFETAVLQVRLICELFLLGATVAHIEDGVEGISDKKWRPKDVFFDLSKANTEHPLPIPVEVHPNRNGEGQHHAEWLSLPMPFESLSYVYGVCGDFLHVPTVRQVLKGTLATIDLLQLKRWIDGFRRLVMGHALMLPERQTVLLCTWCGDSSAPPQLFKLVADGPSTADLSTLPKFELFP